MHFFYSFQPARRQLIKINYSVCKIVTIVIGAAHKNYSISDSYYDLLSCGILFSSTALKMKGWGVNNCCYFPLTNYVPAIYDNHRIIYTCVCVLFVSIINIQVQFLYAQEKKAIKECRASRHLCATFENILRNGLRARLVATCSSIVYEPLIVCLFQTIRIQAQELLLAALTKDFKEASY